MMQFKRIVGVAGLVVLVAINPFCMWLAYKDPLAFEGGFLYATAWIWGGFLWSMTLVILVSLAVIILFEGIKFLILLLIHWATGDQGHGPGT
jgi:hypothetical protein